MYRNFQHFDLDIVVDMRRFLTLRYNKKKNDLRTTHTKKVHSPGKYTCSRSKLRLAFVVIQ